MSTVVYITDEGKTQYSFGSYEIAVMLDMMSIQVCFDVTVLLLE